MSSKQTPTVFWLRIIAITLVLLLIGGIVAGVYVSFLLQDALDMVNKMTPILEALDDVDVKELAATIGDLNTVVAPLVALIDRLGLGQT